ncbi:MAG: hypothetical protein KDC92_10125 [Bacteroidetes bacterium]|nr:hypothetical protein [Bacteroidota bacterium]
MLKVRQRFKPITYVVIGFMGPGVLLASLYVLYTGVTNQVHESYPIQKAIIVGIIGALFSLIALQNLLDKCFGHYILTLTSEGLEISESRIMLKNFAHVIKPAELKSIFFEPLNNRLTLVSKEETELRLNKADAQRVVKFVVDNQIIEESEVFWTKTAFKRSMRR